MNRRFDPAEYNRAANLRNFDRTLAAIAFAAATGPTQSLAERAAALAAKQAKDVYNEKGELVRPRVWDTDVSEAIAPALDHERVEKANVAAVRLESNWTLPASQFIDLVRTESVIGRAPLRRMPFIRSSLEQLTASAANFVGEGAKIIPSKITAADVQLPPYKLAALAVCTKEFAKFAVTGEDGAEALSRELRRRVVEKLDGGFVTGAAVAGTRPAGLDVNASTVASTGTTAAAIATDLRAMMKIPTENGLPLASAFWVMSETAYAYLRLLRVADDSGTVAGKAVIASDSARGKVLLVIGDEVAFAMADDVALLASGEADIEMTDATSMDSITPTAASTNMVSMYQTNSVATMATIAASWQVLGPQATGKDVAVVSLTSATYA